MEDYFDKLVAKTLELLAIDSVQSAPCPSSPFGQGVGDCLAFVDKLATSFGFSTHNENGYYLTADIGQGEQFGILGHVDTVPHDEKWSANPLGELRDGGIYGRGILDDKGPMLACLFATHQLLSENKLPRKQIRFIFGGNEETGWECIERYKKVDKMPREGFSPDGDFPVINCEKGLANYSITLDKPSELVAISGGSRPNVVMPSATATIDKLVGNAGESATNDKIIDNSCDRANATSDKVIDNSCDCVNATSGKVIDRSIDNFFDSANATNDKSNATSGKASDSSTNDGSLVVTYHDGKTILSSTGIPAHASTPSLGKNALWAILNFLSDNLGGEYSTLARLFCNNDGSGLDLAIADEKSGKLTCNLGVIRLTADGKLELTLDVRFPISFSKDFVADKIRAKLPTAKVEIIHFHDPHFIPPETKLVSTLLAVYNNAMNVNEKPLAIGGGTYARALECGVAFGPMFPGQPSTIHQKDEFVTLRDFRKMYEIYYNAISALLF
ncbi:MAG: M20/M25/M40 family metallo-hydrolase [Clostridia bacterium]